MLLLALLVLNPTIFQCRAAAFLLLLATKRRKRSETHLLVESTEGFITLPVPIVVNADDSDC